MYTMDERIKHIKNKCLQSQETNPLELFVIIAANDFVRIHGPEHHFLDGACVLTGFKNAGGDIDLEKALEALEAESLKMPGAMCGYWGVCGAVTSVGAALAIIDKTGPLSVEDWGSHMAFTSKTLSKLSKAGGPRCCKRDAFFALETAVEYINENYTAVLPVGDVKCSFYQKNKQCIKERCPFYNGKN